MARIPRKYLNKIDTMYTNTDTEVASILEDTGTTLSGQLTTIDGIVDSILEDTGTTLPATLASIYSYLLPVESAGNADIDISEADYTGFVEILNVTADGGALADLQISLDYVKATTGIDVVATASDTLDVAVYVDIDGTNERLIQSGTQRTLTGAGTLATPADVFKVGMIPADAVVSVKVKLSAERADAEIPYSIIYRGATPTITVVAAA